jgi:pyrroline-5-carboxylate reductase
MSSVPAIPHRRLIGCSKHGMINAMRIGIIGGRGWIGKSFTSALLEHGSIKPEQLTVSGTALAVSDIPPGVRYTQDNTALVDCSDIVILSVRPTQLESVRARIEGGLLISVMAGVSVAILERITGACRIVRAMPNAAASIGLSYTPYFANAAVTSEDRESVRTILQSIGRTSEVQLEAHIDYMAGLTGSGPAFAAMLADALITHAVHRGLEKALAVEAVQTLLEGAGQLIGSRTRTPSEIVEQFVAYRGTTAAALEAMRDAGFDAAIAAGLEAAERRGKAMSPSA